MMNKKNMLNNHTSQLNVIKLFERPVILCGVVDVSCFIHAGYYGNVISPIEFLRAVKKNYTSFPTPGYSSESI